MFGKNGHATHRQMALSIGGVLLMAATASAAPLDFFAANVQATPIYSAGGGGQWSIPGASFFDGTALTGPDLYFVDPSGFTLGGTVAWTGNPLVSDNSGVFPNVAGQAEGVFGPGGTISISGTLFDMFFTPVFTGVLISGTVSGFSLREPSGFADALDLIIDPIITPTGGVLADGTYATMPTNYYLSFTVAGASQGGGPLVNFQSDIMSIESMQFELTAVPEPGTCLALLCGLGMVAVRRRRD